MCGILGVVADDGEIYRSKIKLMIDSLHHRGSDESRVSCFKNCILGHTRLSIVDLKAGSQPMHSVTSPKCIVFNGEIYGYRDIRDELNDYPFATTSDTEVIIALYETVGAKCLERLPGMFAFAIWDESEKTLFAARDRFGEKPFYYAWGENNEFIFASEIKAILATGLITPILSKTSVQHYLQYLYVHPNHTIYENVFTLPPAHHLTLKKGKISVKRYWKFPEVNDSICVEAAVEQFQVLFDNAVKKQLVADVLVGAFLSGGLDSSTVVAVASRHTDKLRTFSFGFEDASSELPYARQIAEKYGTDHYELTAKNMDIATLLLEMSKVYDEPFADSSNIPTYLVAKHSREHLKVILTGDGGDELLGGYGWWYYPLLGIGKSRSDSEMKIWLIMLIAKIAYCAKLKTAEQLQKKVLCMKTAKSNSSVKEAYSRKGQFFSDNELSELFLNPLNNDKKQISNTWKETNTVNDAMMMDLEDYMPGDILVKIDRASMAHGLELRAPFLDVDFASFCISLPSRLKITNKEDKIILRRAYEQLWTTEIQKRGKQGFGAPVDRWLKRKNVQLLKEHYLNNQNLKIFNILSFEKIQKLTQKDNYKTWILLVLSIWMEEHKFIM